MPQTETHEEALVALPAPPATFAGSTTATGRNWRVTVSNKAGYLCHIHVQSSWARAGPDVLFGILTHPDNGSLLRDMKRVGERRILKSEPGFNEMHVTKCTKVRELWRHRLYRSTLHIIEDSRDPECLSTTFDLVNSEYFVKFSGRWELRPVRDPATGTVVGCRGELQQDVLPKGVPTFLTRLPLVGGALRNVSIRAVGRLLADLQAAVDQVLAGHAAGLTTDQVLQKLCSPSRGQLDSGEAAVAAEAEDEEAGQEGAKPAEAPPSPTSLLYQVSVESGESATSVDTLDAGPVSVTGSVPVPAPMLQTATGLEDPRA